MNYYRFPEKRGWKTAFYLYMFALLMLARDALFFNSVLGFYQTQILMLGVMAVGILAFLVVQRGGWKGILTDKRMLMFILSAVLILLPMVIKRDWQMMYFSILICLFFAVFLTYFVTLKEVAKVYVRIFSVLAVYSILAAYLLRFFPDNGIVPVPVFKNVAGTEFYWFGLSYVPLTVVPERNFGIFREPGVYQYFILLALFLNNYTVEWEKQRTMWIVNILLAVTMLTTMATGGVIELGIFVLIVFFDKKLYRDKRIRAVAIALACVLVAVLIVSFVQKNAIYDFVYATLIQKFVDRTISVTDRADAIFSDLRIFLSHPVLGDRLATVLHTVPHNTTSTMIQYAAFGIFSGSLHVVAWISLVWDRKRSIIWNLALLVTMFMAFNTQNLIADVFFWLFPVMALTERGLPLIKRK